MENEYFLRPHSSYTVMPTWETFSSAMEIQDSQLMSSTGRSQECFLGPNCDRTTADPNIQFDSALSSIVSSPASNCDNIPGESFVIRELIGKLGSIGNSGEISPHLGARAGAGAAAYANSNNTSWFNTPLNSPPKLKLPVIDNTLKEKLPNTMPLNSCLADFMADPGFAERAAKFSCFGSKSFNGRMNQFEMNNAELPHRSNSLMGNGRLSRISSSPSIKAMGSQLAKNNSCLQDRTELPSSQEECAVSEQKLNSPNDSSSRKRKAASKGKAKEPASSPSAPAGKFQVAEFNEDLSAKRCKPNEGDQDENAPVKAQEEQKGNSGTPDDEKQNKTNQKPPEAPKDYIHVRARRGQATDSHSLAERVRREKISERMKLLQDIVPGCNKVTGKAVMLDEIINYVQSLQRQVEFLSMKMASVSTKLDCNVNTIMSKDTYQPSTSSPNQMFSLDSSVSAFYGHQPQQNSSLSASISNVTGTQEGSVDPFVSTTLCQNLGMQLPPVNGLNETFSQYPTFCQDDLQAIVQMGYGKNPDNQADF